MPKKATEKFPGIARWVEAYGTVECGYCRETRSAIRVINEGGLVWSGHQTYKTFDEALADCDTNLTRILREEYGEV